MESDGVGVEDGVALLPTSATTAATTGALHCPRALSPLPDDSLEPRCKSEINESFSMEAAAELIKSPNVYCSMADLEESLRISGQNLSWALRRQGLQEVLYFTEE